MRTLQHLFFFVLPFIGLCSCDSDATSDPTPDGPSAAADVIRFEMGFAPDTRVATNVGLISRWEDGDQIGLFAVSHAGGQTGTLSPTPSGNMYHNVKLSYRQSTGEWIPDEPLYYDGTNEFDFYAYYPYDAGATNPNAIAFDVHPTPRDLLTARVMNVAKSGSAVPLQFSHALSLVEVDISSRGLNVPHYDAGKLSVTLNGVKTKASLNLGVSAGPQVTIPATATDTDVVMTRVSDAGANQWLYRALVPAQSFTAGHRLFDIAQDTDQDGSLTGDDDINFNYIEPSALTLSGGAVKKYAIHTGWDNPDHRYQVGDVYPHAGPKMGIVYWLEPGSDGKHGKIVSLDEGYAMWEGRSIITGATDPKDGLFNMSKVYEVSGGSFNIRNAFYWVDAKNRGSVNYTSGALGVWYLPAIDELLELYVAWNGGAGSSEVNGMRDTFNGWLTSAGGTGIQSYNYCSSTEEDYNNAWYLINNGEKWYSMKSMGSPVRAILAF